MITLHSRNVGQAGSLRPDGIRPAPLFVSRIGPKGHERLVAITSFPEGAVY